MPKKATVTPKIIELMNENQHLTVDDVVPLISQKFNVKIESARYYYNKLVREGKAKGHLFNRKKGRPLEEFTNHIDTVLKPQSVFDTLSVIDKDFDEDYDEFLDLEIKKLCETDGSFY